MKPRHFLTVITGFGIFLVSGCKSDPGKELMQTLSAVTNIIPTQIERQDAVALEELIYSFYDSEHRWPANTDELTEFANLHSRSTPLQTFHAIELTPQSNGDVLVFFRNINGLGLRMKLSPPLAPSQ